MPFDAGFRLGPYEILVSPPNAHEAREILDGSR